MDEQSKNQMVEFLWVEYIRLNIDVEKKRTAHWSPSGFYDMPIGSISGVKLNMFRLRMTEYEMTVLFTLKNANNRHIFPLTSYSRHDIIKTPGTPSDDTERFTKMRIRDGVEKLVVLISSLAFNVRTGMFRTTGQPTLPECFKKLASLGKAKCTEETECCVCYTPTLTQFRPCNHHICGVCISNLNKMICPMCRANYQGDSDYQEDSDYQGDSDEEEDD